MPSPCIPFRLAALALLCGLAAAPAQAQYKWRDGGGQTHVSDLPPPREIPEKDILQRPSATGRTAGGPAALTRSIGPAGPAPAPLQTASGPVPAKPPVDPELEARRKRADDEARAKARAEEDRLAGQRAENCQRARQQLAVLERGQRLVRINERGEPVVMDEAARADDMQAAQRVVASDCR